MSDVFSLKKVCVFPSVVFFCVLAQGFPLKMQLCFAKVNSQQRCITFVERKVFETLSLDTCAGENTLRSMVQFIFNADMQYRYAIQICKTETRYRYAIQVCDTDLRCRHATKMSNRNAMQICDTNIQYRYAKLILNQDM